MDAEVLVYVALEGGCISPAASGRACVTALETRAIAGEVGRAVVDWRNAAAAVGLSPTEVDRMTSAFDHEDLRAAFEMHTPNGENL